VSVKKPKTKLLSVVACIFVGGVALMLLQRNSSPLPAGVRADKVLVEKRARRLSLISGGRIIKSYRVALGRSPVAQKEREGDKRTPEGVYTIDRHNDRSGFYKALHVSYPSAEQRAKAANLGIDPGGDIMIHGLRNRFGWIGSAHRIRDWTAGCIAVTNPEIDEVFDAVPDGTVVEIVP
jgi:murein L,D-transpeptidase YafK